MTTRITVTGTPGEVAALVDTASASGRLRHRHGPYPLSECQHRVDLLLDSDTDTPPPAPERRPHRATVATTGLLFPVSAGLGVWVAGFTGALLAVALVSLLVWLAIEARTTTPVVR